LDYLVKNSNFEKFESIDLSFWYNLKEFDKLRQDLVFIMYTPVN